MNTAILALYLGTQTGWAVRQNDGQINSGSETFKPQRFEGGGMRYLRFKRWLTEIKHSGEAAAGRPVRLVVRHPERGGRRERHGKGHRLQPEALGTP